MIKEKLRILIKNYGCTANQNDGEIMAGLLEKNNHDVFFENSTNIDENKFDIIIINSCVVKGPTLKRMERKIIDALAKCKFVIISGCMGKAYLERIEEIRERVEKKYGKRYIAVIGPDNIKEILNVINDLIENKDVILIEEKNNSEIVKSKKRLNRVIGIVQIARGCSGYCSYCITKAAKGSVKSFDLNPIVETVKQDVKEGCKEIWLTATDTGCYGLDKGKYLLNDLLENIMAINARFWVRVGMMNPNHLINFYEKFFEIMENDKMFKFLHLPLQSASNRVLKEMKREYSIENWLFLAKEFKKRFPKGTLATDIITGFYNETEEDFKETIKIIKKIKPEVVNISRFWPMPKTIAYEKSKNRIKEIEKNAKERSKILFNLCKKISLEKNKEYIGEVTKILIDKKGYVNTYLGRDINYRLFAIRNKKLELGKFYKVRIKKAMSNWLIAEIIED